MCYDRNQEKTKICKTITGSWELKHQMTVGSDNKNARKEHLRKVRLGLIYF